MSNLMEKSTALYQELPLFQEKNSAISCRHESELSGLSN